MMCKQCFKKVNNRTKREMLYCHLLEKEEKEMNRLCLFQKFCKDEDAYILNRPERCKNYVCV